MINKIKKDIREVKSLIAECLKDFEKGLVDRIPKLLKSLEVFLADEYKKSELEEVRVAYYKAEKARKLLEEFLRTGDLEKKSEIETLLREIMGLEEKMGKNKGPIPVLNLKEFVPGIRINGLNEVGINKEVKNIAQKIQDEEIFSDYQAFFGRDIPTTYAFNTFEYLKSNPKKIDLIKGLIKNSVVVDLGAGRLIWSYFIAIRGMAKAYIAVEPYHYKIISKDLRSCLEEQILSLGEKKRIPYCVIGEDMLRFLQRLPKNSVSIFLFGIDSTIITNTGYEEEVNKNIYRVLSKKGAIVSYGTSEEFISDKLRLIHGIKEGETFLKVYKK